MRLSDFSKGPTGLFVLNVYRDGKLIETFEEENLVVDLSKTAHSKLIGGSVTGQSITQIGFGTNGTTPVAGNTGLTGTFLKAIDSVSYPTSTSTQFAFSLGSAENNGVAIMEFGLFTGGSSLYARKVRSTALNKASDVSLSGTWTITF